MEREGSLPCLQVPATCPCPEPDQSSPHTHTHPPSQFLKIHRNIILPTMPGSSKWCLSLLMAYSKAKEIKHVTILNRKCQTNVCLPELCYRLHSDTFLLALPVSWGYQTQREYYIKPPSYLNQAFLKSINTLCTAHCITILSQVFDKYRIYGQ